MSAHLFKTISVFLYLYPSVLSTVDQKTCCFHDYNIILLWKINSNFFHCFILYSRYAY